MGRNELFLNRGGTTRFISNSTLGAVHADELHRDHAIIEQTIAELKDGPLAHAPSGKFTANAAWLALAVTAFNLLRAAGAAASTRHARARWATLRRTPHRRPRPDRHPRPTADPALAHTLALADRLARPVDRGHLSLTGTTDGPRNDLQWKSRADRPIARGHTNRPPRQASKSRQQTVKHPTSGGIEAYTASRKTSLSDTA
jgi:hypothetical protein